MAPLEKWSVVACHVSWQLLQADGLFHDYAGIPLVVYCLVLLVLVLIQFYSNHVVFFLWLIMFILDVTVVTARLFLPHGNAFADR